MLAILPFAILLQIQCHNDTSGYVDINASGATAPYFINTSSFNDSITVGHFSEGVYTFLVYDSNGCEYEETITFNEPSLIMHNFVENHVLSSLANYMLCYFRNAKMSFEIRRN